MQDDVLPMIAPAPQPTTTNTYQCVICDTVATYPSDVAAFTARWTVAPYETLLRPICPACPPLWLTLYGLAGARQKARDRRR